MRVVQSIEAFDFDWDAEKSAKVLATREIDFIQVANALLQPQLSQSSNKHGESRTLAICKIEEQFVRVIYTKRDGVCRIITAMAARRYEREEYCQVFGG